MVISTRDAEVISGHKVIVVIALPQELVDPEGGSSINFEGELPRDPEKELLGDPERDFLHGLIQYKIWESYLEKLQSKNQIPPDFELEILLET